MTAATLTPADRKKRILYDSPEAASMQTVTGWVAANGQFWGADEHMARWVGATHRVCEQNPEHGEHEVRGYCEKCRAERMQARFDAMPRKPWDGAEPVVIFDSDLYFFDGESLRDHMLDNDITVADIQLCFCKPQHAEEIYPGEHFSDLLPEDGDDYCFTERLREAFDALNDAIRAEPPLSWVQDNVVAVLPADFLSDEGAAE